MKPVVTTSTTDDGVGKVGVSSTPIATAVMKEDDDKPTAARTAMKRKRSSRSASNGKQSVRGDQTPTQDEPDHHGVQMDDVLSKIDKYMKSDDKNRSRLEKGEKEKPGKEIDIVNLE